MVWLLPAATSLSVRLSGLARPTSACTTQILFSRSSLGGARADEGLITNVLRIMPNYTVEVKPAINQRLITRDTTILQWPVATFFL